MKHSLPLFWQESGHFLSKPSGEETMVHLPMVLSQSYYHEKPLGLLTVALMSQGSAPQHSPAEHIPSQQRVPSHSMAAQTQFQSNPQYAALMSPLLAGAHFQGVKHSCSAMASALQIGSESPCLAGY